MADRIGVMRDGRMAQVGTPAELYERPADRFGAGFLGAANILPCQAAADGVTVGLAELGVVVQAARAGVPGRGLLALRAERLRVGVVDSCNQLAGVVIESAYAGDSLAVTVRLRNDTLLRTVRGLADGVEAARIQPGAAVVVGREPDACILLPE